MRIELMGAIKNKDTFDIDLNMSIKEIYNTFTGNNESNKKIKMVQIGGPLGATISGLDLKNKLETYREDLYSNSILFLDELMCPVDYLRFITRFVIREVKYDSSFVRTLAEYIEEIAHKDSSEDLIEKINKIISERKAKNIAEERIINIFNYVLDKFSVEIKEHINEDKCRNGICRGLFKAQCINACPAEVNVPGYVELMKRKDFEGAYKLMKQNNPLSFICGKVCARPCESRCRRGEIEDHVGVRALKRFAAEFVFDNIQFTEDKLNKNGKKVAIIGAGPAGLSGAYYLGKSGYEVTVFEANDRVGGMLATGIPEYRLPQNTIDLEVEVLKDLNVEIKLGVKIGRDVEFNEIKEKFDAVLLATGCPIGNEIPNNKAENIETAVKLLKEVKVAKRTTIGDTTYVIGGGDVAMDAARTAKRLGATKVTVITLEKFNHIPASKEEKDGAIKEGIEFLSGYGTDSIEIKEGKFKSIKLKKCISIFDEEYKFSPLFDEDDTIELKGNHLIFAIGQRPDLKYLECMGIKDQRFIKESNFHTEIDGVFAAGDIIRPNIAIKAIADGKQAAIEIDKYLDGNGIYLGDEINIPETVLDSPTWDYKLLKEKHIFSNNLKDNFEEVSKTCSLDEAICEAKRCMRCDRNSTQRLYLK